MGLKNDLMEAKLKGLELSGAKKEDLEEAKKSGSPLEIQAEMEKEAIIKFLTEAELKVTELKIPVVVEQLKTPDQAVDMALQTLLGDKAPILDTIKKIPGGGALVKPLEAALKTAIKPLLEGGATLPGLQLAKDDG